MVECDVELLFAKESLFCSKLTIMELCGWVEESMDDVVLRYSRPGRNKSGTSRSAVSRRFVRGTARKLATLMERDLSELGLKVLMLDGVHYAGDHVMVAGVGIDSRGQKHVLGLWEGATENKATCTALL